VRDANSPVGPVSEGDYIALTKDGIVAVAPDLGEAASALLEHLVDDAHEIVTVIEGEGATPADTRRITEWLAEHRPDVNVEVHHGGQPLYPYLVSVE
jgi:dihydroxyacetone kinase-like predicted kinase